MVYIQNTIITIQMLIKVAVAMCIVLAALAKVLFQVVWGNFLSVSRFHAHNEDEEKLIPKTIIIESAVLGDSNERMVEEATLLTKESNFVLVALTVEVLAEVLITIQAVVFLKMGSIVVRALLEINRVLIVMDNMAPKKARNW